MLATGAAALPVLAAGAVAAGAVSASARARLGGQTGDVLGAAQILSETAIWLAFAAQAG
jgi:adenosylcobinamide-GDP ribazoletransferase